MIPRAVRHLFAGIASRIEAASSSGLPQPKFSITAQFLELYNEEIVDLFDTTRESVRGLLLDEESVFNFYGYFLLVKEA